MDRLLFIDQLEKSPDSGIVSGVPFSRREEKKERTPDRRLHSRRKATLRLMCLF
jgi:hypothetical protein